MFSYRYIFVGVLTGAVLAGCSSMPQSPTLDEAQSRYNSARANPQVSASAPLELKEAADAVMRARAAQSNGEDASVVDSLAYVAKQKVAIAEETARRKNAETMVDKAAEERTKAQLEARTQEADQAKQQAMQAQQSAEEKAAALAAANAAAEQDKMRLAAAAAAAEEAKRQAAESQASAAQDQARLQELQAQMDELQAKKTDRGMVITLGDVLFDSGKATLKPGGLRNVQKLGAFLNKYPQRKVQIEGFTDSVGSESYNLELSRQRADAVGAALRDMGIGADRVLTRGYGESLPVASNANKAGRQLNRRVEIVLSDEAGNIRQR